MAKNKNNQPTVWVHPEISPYNPNNLLAHPLLGVPGVRRYQDTEFYMNSEYGSFDPSAIRKYWLLAVHSSVASYIVPGGWVPEDMEISNPSMTVRLEFIVSQAKLAIFPFIAITSGGGGLPADQEIAPGSGSLAEALDGVFTENVVDYLFLQPFFSKYKENNNYIATGVVDLSGALRWVLKRRLAGESTTDPVLSLMCMIYNEMGHAAVVWNQLTLIKGKMVVSRNRYM
jgi:hypothetical protein